jgi:hypothetical protein
VSGFEGPDEPGHHDFCVAGDDHDGACVGEWEAPDGLSGLGNEPALLVRPEATPDGQPGVALAVADGDGANDVVLVLTLSQMRQAAEMLQLAPHRTALDER